MKKIYLPILFLISFVYTKIAFNEFNFSTQKISEVGTSRAPASEPMSDDEDHRNRQTQNLLLADYFSKSLETFLKDMNSKDKANLNVLVDFQGSIIGNPTVVNFGFWLDDKGRAFLGVNDLKEVGYGQFSHDVLRHYVSAKIINKNLNWQKYFHAYSEGIQKLPYQNSFYTEKGLDLAHQNAKEHFSKNISLHNNFKLVNVKSAHRLKEKEKSKVINSLKKYFTKAVVYDIASLPDQKGYYVSWRLYPHERVEWYLVEEMQDSVYSKFFPESNKVSYEDRFHEIQDDIFNSRLKDSLFYILLQEKSYLVRPISRYANILSWEEIPEDDYEEVILDQAYTLGMIHRYSLLKEDNEISRYLDAWKKIPTNHFEETVIELKYKAYDSFKNNQ